MARQEYDFVGWATKNDIKCSDGRTIRHNAFADNDGKRVPLVWNHNHNDIDNVLGYAILKNEPTGVRAYGFFNSTEKGRNAKTILNHGDISSLSIYANKLQHVGADVVHGDIKEVSLVLAGANPGAYIDEIRHGEDSILDEVILSTGEEVVIEHSELDDDPSQEIGHSDDEKEPEAENLEKEGEEESEKEPEVEKPAEEPESLEHADKEKEDLAKEAEEKLEEGEQKMADNEKKETEVKEEKTVKDVLDTMNEEQLNATKYLVGQALANAAEAEEDDEKEEDEEMKHNFFDNDSNSQDTLMHTEIMNALKDGKRNGSVRESLKAHDLDPAEVLVHGVEHVDYMFPEAQLATGRTIPTLNTNPNGWVNIVMNGVHKTPFSKVKSVLADIRADDARARGYAKGSKKKDEVFKLLKRAVNPTTIYKKQTIDRDDMIDLEEGNIDFIAMIKQEMSVKWDEEVARQILFGDGREVTDPDKIDDSAIIPVIKDTTENVYAMLVEVTPAEGQAEADAVIDAAVRGLDDYQGSGNTIAFMSSSVVTDMILMKDKFGHRLYKDLQELASAMTVDRIVKVPSSIVPTGFYGVILDLADYNIGSNKLGERSLFDDFDIDYNQQKYLLEGRRSGALIQPHSAVVLAAASNDGE